MRWKAPSDGGIGGGGGGTIATPPAAGATGTGNILWILAGGGTEAGGGLAMLWPDSSSTEVFLSLLLPAMSWASNAFRMES